MSEVAVRYIVNDVAEAIAFYTAQLGFEVEIDAAPGFAALRRGELRLLVNAPGAGAAGQAMPDGTTQGSGGWNRFQLEVENLGATVEELRARGAHFRNDIVVGRGGRQILLQDPSGNVIGLFEPPRR